MQTSMFSMLSSLAAGREVTEDSTKAILSDDPRTTDTATITTEATSIDELEGDIQPEQTDGNPPGLPPQPEGSDARPITDAFWTAARQFLEIKIAQAPNLDKGRKRYSAAIKTLQDAAKAYIDAIDQQVYGKMREIFGDDWAKQPFFFLACTPEVPMMLTKFVQLGDKAKVKDAHALSTVEKMIRNISSQMNMVERVSPEAFWPLFLWREEDKENFGSLTG